MLRDEHNIIPKSQTDTEVVALVIGTYLDKGEKLLEAIKSTVAVLEGAYSFILISILDPDAMYIVKHCGTMVIGFPKSLMEQKAGSEKEGLSLDNLSEISADQIDEAKPKQDHRFQIVTSDTTVFQEYTKSYYNIEDKEILRLSLRSKIEQHKIKTIIEEGIQVQLPPGISHYYIMEMMEQSDAVARTLGFGGRLMGGENMVKLGGLDTDRTKLCELENLIIAACGTSYRAGQYGEILMKEMAGLKYVEALIASEISERDFPRQNGGFLSISQSGETMDLLIPFRLAKEHGLTRINVVNKNNSTLARENHIGVFLHCGREFSVASTKAFVCQVTALTLVAIWFAQNKNFNGTKKIRQRVMNELKMLSTNFKLTLESVEKKSKEIAPLLKTSKHIFFCGTGLCSVIAQEAALKMKELSYVHCQDINI
jgi:glucosamine--fructose-6-phosphate aminotransferase (isomerizing)